MKISNDLINIIEAALDTLIKASGMDLRLHGLENVPDHPVLYVINHFTRIETILMPCIIKKNIKKQSWPPGGSLDYGRKRKGLLFSL